MQGCLIKKFSILLAFIMLAVWEPVSGQAETREKNQISYAFDDWVPMCFMDEYGNGAGLLVDVARQVFEKELGLNLVCVKRPWKRAQLEVKNGTSDFIITVATPDRKAYAHMSQHAFYILPLYVYTYAGHGKLEAIDKIRSARDIKALNLMPVTNLGNGWHKDNIDDFGIRTHYVRNEDNILLFLAKKRADIMIDAVVPTNYLIRQNGLSQKIVMTKSMFSRVAFHLLISRKSKYASWMDRIDTAYEKAEKSGRIQAIVSGYERFSNQ